MSTYRFPLGLSDIYNDGYSCDLRKSKAMYVGGNQYMQTQSYTITVDVTGEDGQAGYYISSNNIGGYLFNWKIVNGYGTTEQDHNEYVFFGNDISWDCLSGTERVGKVKNSTEITMYNDQSTNYHYTHYMSLSNSTFSLSICPTIIIVIPAAQPYALQVIPGYNEQTPSTVLCTVNCKYAFYANEPSNTGYSYNSAWPTGYIKTNSFNETYSETVPTNNSGLLNRLFKPTAEETNSFIGYFITDLNYDSGYLKCNPTTFTDLNIDSMSAYQSVYLFVKSVIDITSYGESSSYPLGGYPTTYFSADVFGPFYLVYIPSTTFAMSCDMEHLLQIDAPANAKWNNNTLYFPSCSNDITYSDMLSIVYGPVGMSDKYCFVKPINSSNTTYITCTNEPFEVEYTTSSGYTVTEKKSVTVKGNAYSASSTLSLSSDSYSAVNADVSIYNAYDVEVYSRGSYTTNDDIIVRNSNFSNYIVNSSTNGTIRTTDTIYLSQGAYYTLYIREVIKEKDYNGGNQIEHIFDFRNESTNVSLSHSNVSIYALNNTPTLTRYYTNSSNYIDKPVSTDILYCASTSIWTGSAPVGSIYRLDIYMASDVTPYSTDTIEITGLADNFTLRIPVEVSGIALTDFTTSYVQNESSGNVSSGWISMSNNGSYTINTAAASGYIHILTTPDPSTATLLDGGFTVSGTACDPINSSTSIGNQFQIPYYRYGSVNLTITTGTITRTYSFTISPLAITDITVKDSDNHEISSVDLWEVPEEYNDENYNATVWQLSGQEINLSFTPSPSGNNFFVSCPQGLGDIFNLTNFTIPYTTNNIVWNDNTNNLDVLENGDAIEAGDTFNCDPSSGNVRTTILFPHPGANEDLHSTGTYQLSFISDNENASVIVNVYRTSITLTASISGSSYNADTSINIVLTKTGDETWTDVLNGVTVTGTSLPTGFAVSTQNTTNTISVKFPASMTNNWSGTLTVNAKNHYGQTISAITSSITIAPVAISGITTSYCDENGDTIDPAYIISNGEDVDIDSYTGDSHWFEYPGYIYFTGVVGPPTATNRNVTISLADNTTNSRIPTGDETKASDEVFTVVLTGKNTNPSTQTKIKLAAAGASSIYTEYYITPLMYTNTLTAKRNTSPYSTIGNTRINVEAGSFEDIRIYFNGNESSSSMANRMTTSCSSSISSVDVSVQSIPSNSDYIVYRISPPSSITSTTNGTITFTYNSHTVDVNIKVVIDQSIYSIELTPDENVVYGEEYVKLTISPGSSVSSYVLEGTEGLKYATSYNGPWSDGNASGLTFNTADCTEIYVKNVSSSLVIKTFTATASQHDTGETSASDSVEVTFGTIEYTQSIKNGSGNARTYSGTVSAYAGDNVTYTAKLTPALEGTVNPGSYWNVSGHSYSNFRNVTYSTGGDANYTRISFFGEIQTANTATSATFYKDSFEGNSHTFSLPAANVWDRNDDSISLAPDYLVLNAIQNQTVSITTDVQFTANTHVAKDTLSFSYSTSRPIGLNAPSYDSQDEELTLSSTTAPNSQKTYYINVTGENELGDAISFNSIGTLIWIEGFADSTFNETNGETTKTVYGNNGNSAEYGIVCTYEYGGETITVPTDRITLQTPTSGDWWTAGWKNNDKNTRTIVITTTAKNYNLPSGANDGIRTATVTLTTTFDGNHSGTLTLTFKQRPLDVQTTFNITSSDPSTSISGRDVTSAFRTVGETKSYTISCSHKEREKSGDSYVSYDDTYSISNFGTTSSSNNGYSKSTSGNALSVTASDNKNSTTTRTNTLTVTTSHVGERTETYNFSFTQSGCSYSGFTIKVNNSTEASYTVPNYPATGSTTAVSVPIVVSYIKSYDAVTQTLYGTWTPTYSGYSSWLNMTPASGTSVSGNSNSFVINSVSANGDESVRNATVTITGKFNGLSADVTRTINISQSGTSTSFEPSQLSLACDQTSSTVNVASNTAWSITNNISWITNISPATSGSGSQTLTLTSAQNYKSGITTDYSKYRIDTSTRSGNITITSNSTSTNLSISQAGYIWNRVYQCSTINSVNASTTSVTFTLKTNYDYELETSSEWILLTDSNNQSINVSNKFSDNDDATKTDERTYTVRLYCNHTSSERRGTITVKQIKHNSNEDSVNHTISISQGAATYDIKIYDENDNLISPPGQGMPTPSLEFGAMGDLNKIIKIVSKFGGWSVDNLTSTKIENYRNPNGDHTSSGGWFDVNVNSDSYTTPTFESEVITTITITVLPNFDIESGREHTIIFSNTSDQNVTASIKLAQPRATVYLTYVSTSSLDDEHTALEQLEYKKEHNIDIISSSVQEALTPSLDNSNETDRYYYIFYFYGGAVDYKDMLSPVIGGSNTNIVNVSEHYITTWADGSSIVQGSEKIYRYKLHINTNNDTYIKTATVKLFAPVNNIGLEIIIQQPAKSYNASGNFEFTNLNSYHIGEWNQEKGKYMIPVYGDTYEVKVKNKLEYDSLDITGVWFDKNAALNPDQAVDEEVDTASWATITIGGQPVSRTSFYSIGANLEGTISITINPYDIKESAENGEVGINLKTYNLIVEAKAHSDNSQDPYSIISLQGQSWPNAWQESVDLNEPSWKLLGGEPDEHGISKIYAFNKAQGNFVPGSGKTVYSADTGDTVLDSGGIIHDETEDVRIQNLLTIAQDYLNSTGEALSLDERFGVK